MIVQSLTSGLGEGLVSPGRAGRVVRSLGLYNNGMRCKRSLDVVKLGGRVANTWGGL